MRSSRAVTVPVASPVHTADATPFGGPYAAAVSRLLASYRSIPPTGTVRLAKKTSNLFRARQPLSGHGLDVTGLDTVLSIDRAAGTADVGGMCTYETLVAETLRWGMSPVVVPQLKTITVGGAVTGLGIESTSFRAGLVHESVVEMDILTGSGELITARPEGPHAELFYGFPNSFGSLGYATRVRIQLEQVARFVALQHLRFNSLAELQTGMTSILESGSSGGARVDYIDGVVFSAGESYLTVGTRTDAEGPTSDYTGQQIYYRSLQQRTVDRLTISDYLWRWDTDWFWCSRAFGAQQSAVRRLWPKRFRRSSVYWKLVALDRRLRLSDRLERLHGRPPLERVVQDVEIPLAGTAEFLAWFFASVPIEPVWLCPIRQRPSRRGAEGTGRTWPLYPLESGRTYVNIGFWSAVPAKDGDGPGAANRRIEERVTASGGHKSLYSDSFYTREDFAQLYGGQVYQVLKERYDPAGRLPGMYEKTVTRA